MAMDSVVLSQLTCQPCAWWDILRNTGMVIDEDKVLGVCVGGGRCSRSVDDIMLEVLLVHARRSQLGGKEMLCPHL